MAHLLMYSTNYTVCRRSACHNAQALVATRDRSSTASLHPPCTISVFQALAEALTTSKDMVGRRLVACSDFDKWGIPNFVEDTCALIVNGVTAIADAAVAAANNIADVALKAANAVKDLAEKARDAAQSAYDAVTSWIDELGRDIQCVRAPSNPRGSPR